MLDTHLHKALSGLAIIVALIGCATSANAQGGPGGPGAPGGGPQGPQPIKVMLIHDNVYWSNGGPPSNTGFIVGTDGVIVFDPKGTEDAARTVIAEIKKITNLPITTIICSHANPDHTLGLPAYPKGINIIMQRDAAKEVEDLTFYKTWVGGGGDRAGGDKPYLATQVVDTRAALKISGVNLVLLHWAPAHTSGDLILFLPDQKIAFLGDLGGAGVHLENNGSTEGSIESLRGLIGLDADTYVRGHGTLATKADLQKSLDDVEARRAKVVALYSAGKTLDEAEQAMGEKPNPRAKGALPGLNTFRAGRDMNFTEIVYYEMSRR